MANRFRLRILAGSAPRGFFAFLCCMSLAGCAQVKSGVEYMHQRLQDASPSSRTEMVTADRLNVRAEPSTKAKILAQLKNGDLVTVHGEKGRWVNIATKGGENGWVHSAYLTGFAGDDKKEAVSTNREMLSQNEGTTERKDTPSQAQPATPKPLAEAKQPLPQSSETIQAAEPAPSEKTLARNALMFRRVHEPRERAFTVLVPEYWQVEGGILRVDPVAQGGPAQSIAAKLDFVIKKDPNGTVMVRWLPDIAWYDHRHSPAGQMGVIRVGGNYKGMTVMPLMPAQDFLQQVVFAQYHRDAGGVEITETRRLEKLAQAYHEASRIVAPMLAPYLRYDAALMRVRYTENNMRYEELSVTVIEDMGAAGAGMWNNKLTFYMRAPAGEYTRWEPIFAVINQSVKIDPAWMAGEVKGQLVRNQILDKTEKEIQRIGREISEHRYRTNAEIQNDMFLTLMGQEEYVNPYTNEIEIGTDKWKHRWINQSGEVLYTDDGSYDPNVDVHLNRSDYKRTPIRKRFPQ